MRRLLINGSPRGKSGNTAVILSWIAEGLGSVATDRPADPAADCPADSGDGCQTFELAHHADLDEHVRLFLEADEVVLAMPLYTDSMPGIVKRFIDELASPGAAEQATRNAGTRMAGKRVSFIVQSGFPESRQSETLALYLERLCRRLGWLHGGTILRGGMEGTRLMPEKAQKKTHDLFVRAAQGLASKGSFDPEAVRILGEPYLLPPFRRFLFSLLSRTGITNIYWFVMLKKHKAFARRFDAPYGKSFRGIAERRKS